MENTHYFQSPVIASSGLMGIVGEGYAYHKILKFFLPNTFSFEGVTFQNKTITAYKREGNMKLSEKDGITPINFYPKCIYVNIRKKYCVNNVSLSNPGIYAVLNMGELQKIEGELHLSIMLVSTTPKERKNEVIYIVAALVPELKNFKASKIFLHYNVSCPNTGHDSQKLFLDNFKEEHAFLKLLKLPIFLKVGWDFPIDVALELQKSCMISGIDAINSIPFDQLRDNVKIGYFKLHRNGYYISPLDKYQESFNVKGRGGVSGDPIRQFALDWIREAREKGFILPITGGGGILSSSHVYEFKEAGATAISIGSIAFLCPWNLSSVVETAFKVFEHH